MISTSPFGKTTAGAAATLYKLTNDSAASISVTDYGATLTRVEVPDRRGDLADVVLGFDSVEGYQSGDNAHFGCTTGRVANRIAGGRFTIDGVEYQIACKHGGPNALHGGVDNTLDKKLWSAEPRESADGDAVVFRYTSPDGEENFPGKLNLTVTFTLTPNNAVHIDYRATTSKPTPVNLTNHSYFNLQGAGVPSIGDHVLQIHADYYTPGDETQIPTGELAPVEGTPLDFRQETAIGARVAQLANTVEGGYDHNYVINQLPLVHTAPSGLTSVNGYTGSQEKPGTTSEDYDHILKQAQAGNMKLAAKLFDPESGRYMMVVTTQPGVQLYTAKGLSGQTGKDGKTYPSFSACCLETQHFPDSVNQPTFPNTLLRPGEVYQHSCVYAFDVR